MRKNSACLSSHHEMYSKTIVYEMFCDNTKKVTFSSYHWYTLYSNNVILYLISTLSGG